MLTVTHGLASSKNISVVFCDFFKPVFITSHSFLKLACFFFVFSRQAFSTDFSQFKTCKKYRFSNRNASNDADIVKPISVWKIPTFTVQEPFCRFARMSFLPRNLTAALPRSLPTGRSSHSHIPFGRSFNFQSTTGGICQDRKFDLSAKRKIKSRHISTLIIGESFVLASNQMLICDGFESFKRPYCLRRLNSTLNSTKNNGGESRYAPKGEYRRYSGLVPNYTSTKTSYSVIYLTRGYFIIT